MVKKVASAEHISIPDHVSLLLSRISLGNLRRALLSFEALYAQDPAFKSIKPDHSLLASGKQAASDIDAVPRPDWEKYAAKTAEKILSEQKPETLLEVRGMFYELLVHCIPAQLILAVRFPCFACFPLATRRVISLLMWALTHGAILVFAHRASRGGCSTAWTRR